MTALDHLWLVPPPDLALPTQEVHVWRVMLEQSSACIHRLSQPLSDDERVRAERFRFERDRRRFRVARGALRAILGRYLDVEPGRLRFGYGAHGKPYLTQEFNHCGLRFNLAHSNELAVYAFACEREIGIDVEYIHPLPDAEQIAVRFFSKREVAVFLALPESQKLEAFFNCWTRKEAYIKAIGDGLAHPLDQFQVSLAPGEPARLLNVEGSPEQVAYWFMAAFMPASGYVAALMAQAPDCRLECWQYLPEADGELARP